MKGEVVKLDKEDGAEDEKYYTIKGENGKMQKMAPKDMIKEIKEGHYEDAEEHLSKANDADAEGDKLSFHAHMADHHDEMSQWHESKGRSASADKHADKADHHSEKAADLARGVKEEQIDEVASHSELAALAHKAYIAATSQGLVHLANHYLQRHKKHKALA